jgi:ribosome-associated protein
MSNRDSVGPLGGPLLYWPGPAGCGRGGGAQLEALDLARRIVELAEDRQAVDIVLLDIRPISLVADYFVICSGTSERHLGALVREIGDTLKRQEQIAPLHVEGDAGSGWVLLDYGEVIVHVFTTQEREYYQLEELWRAATPLVRIQ